MPTITMLATIRAVQAGGTRADVPPALPEPPPGDRVPIQSESESWRATWWPIGTPPPEGYIPVSQETLYLANQVIEAGIGGWLGLGAIETPGSFAAPTGKGFVPPGRPARGFQEQRILPPGDPRPFVRIQRPRAPLPPFTQGPQAPRRPPRAARPPRAPRVPRPPRPPRRPRLMRPARPPRLPRPPRPPRPRRSPRGPHRKNTNLITSCKYSCGGGGCWSTGDCYGYAREDISFCCFRITQRCQGCLDDGCSGPAAGILKAMIGLLPRGWFPSPPKPAVSDYQKYVKWQRAHGILPKPGRIEEISPGVFDVAPRPVSTGIICSGGTVPCCGMTGVRCGAAGPSCGHCTARDLEAFTIYF